MGVVATLHPQACLKDNSDMKSRRTIHFTNPPEFTLPDSRRQTPPKGILKKTDRDAAADVTPSKNLVMGQVKILKRGEPLNDCSTVLKEVNDRKVSNGAASTPEKRSKVLIGGRRVLPTKKKVGRDKMLSEVEASKGEDVLLSSTRRLGPDPDIMSKQMKNISDCFAGSAFSDSPPPSSVPLPGFFRKKIVAPVTVKEDATTSLRRLLGLSLV